MAILRAGILGNLRGKVAGVVGSQWKDKNYVREYVKPANPNTAAQQTQRTKMADTVDFAKTLVGPVFNAYTDKFSKSMSGFNFFIKRNIAIFDGTPDYTIIKLTEGKLHAPDSVVVTYDSGTPVVTFNWGNSLGNNGLATDVVFGCVLDTETGIWYFFAAEDTRNGTPAIITVPGTMTSANLKAWVWAVQMQGTLVSIISDSVFDQVQDA